MCRDWEVSVLRPSVALSEGAKEGDTYEIRLGQPLGREFPHLSVPGE